MPLAPATFERLMLPHLDAAYNLARWILRDPHDAEDAVQDACVRACRALPHFRGEDGRAWLLRIVRNTCYSHLRKTRREPESEAFADDSHTSTCIADANAADWLEARADRVRQALEKLPTPARELIVLYEIEGLSYRQIADIADIPLGTVMSRLARARGRLLAELKSHPAEGAQHGT